MSRRVSIQKKDLQANEVLYNTDQFFAETLGIRKFEIEREELVYSSGCSSPPRKVIRIDTKYMTQADAVEFFSK